MNERYKQDILEFKQRARSCFLYWKHQEKEVEDSFRETIKKQCLEDYLRARQILETTKQETLEGDTILGSFVEAGEEFYRIDRKGLERIYIFHADSYKLLVERS